MMTTKAQLRDITVETIRAEEVIRLALRGLPQMVDPATNLFCHRAVKTENGLERIGISHRYTMMTLLGLFEAEQAGFESPIVIGEQLSVLLKNLNWITNSGDLGLLLWTCAVIAPEELPALYPRLGLATVLTRFADAQSGYTMELAWVLAGLAHAALVDEKARDFRGLADTVYSLLKRNQGKAGLFGHLDRKAGLRGMLRGRFGSFADQVYPIYSFSRYSQAFGSKEALDRASECAHRICALQGSRGEWWWHYDASSGDVAEGYPVYSVHQHGMAPMALCALSDASGEDFDRSIHRGLQWITGDNDLGYDMRDNHFSVIWRCHHHPTPGGPYLRVIADVVGLHRKQTRRLTALQECWPYELGWALYALAPRIRR